MKKNIQEAKMHLRKAQELAAKITSPLKGLSLDKAIEKMREVREELWEEKLEAGSRHK